MHRLSRRENLLRMIRKNGGGWIPFTLDIGAIPGFTQPVFRRFAGRIEKVWQGPFRKYAEGRGWKRVPVIVLVSVEKVYIEEIDLPFSPGPEAQKILQGEMRDRIICEACGKVYSVSAGR